MDALALPLSGLAKKIEDDLIPAFSDPDCDGIPALLDVMFIDRSLPPGSHNFGRKTSHCQHSEAIQ
jgi:hypothetical protein